MTKKNSALPDQLYISDTLRMFTRVMLQQRKRFFAALLLPVGAVLFSVATPYYAGQVLAGIAQQSRHLDRAIMLLGASSLLGVICNRFGFNSFMVNQARTLSALHTRVFNHLLQRSVGFHTNRIGGKLVSDAMDYVSAYGALSTAVLTTGLPFVLSLLIGLAAVFINSWQLGLFLLGVVAITLGWAYLESRRRAELRNRRLKATKALTAHLSDTIVNAQTVKMFSQEHHELQHNKQLNKTLEHLRIRDWQRAGRSGSNRVGALLAMQLLMIIFIVHLTRQNPAMLATGIFAFTYTMTLSNRLFEINNLTRQIDEALLQASPMTAMLRETVEIQDVSRAANLKVSEGTITLKDIDFAYTDSSQHSTVFHNLNLHVKPGEKIGLVGPSGGGKSTLTRLLLRFDDVQGGSITIDGQNIAEVTQTSLRKAVAYVPQEPLLFHRPVGENIAYGQPGADRKTVIQAARKAHADEFITGLSDGYDTVVGERGVKLSGGQRQRVAIARAILKDAPILLLDEATSALDSESEVLIQEALWELMKGRTALVIAHRLSTIQKMDRIIVLDNGRIVEEGTHTQLLANKKGLYAKLWAHQSGGFLENDEPPKDEA